MSNDKTSLGQISLWASIAGIVVPVVLFVLLVIWTLLFVRQGRMGPSGEDATRIIVGLVVCLVVFAVFELVALGCGIAARHTATGKTGLVISSVLLTLAIGVTALVLQRSDFFKRF